MARDDIGKWALPGAFLRAGETLAQAVERSLREKLGVQGVRPRQLYVFDDPASDHPAIVRLAKQHIRSRYEAEPDPERLPGSRFTLRELRLVHEDVAGHELKRDTFRLTMWHRLEATGVMKENTGTRGRPAELFRRKA